MSPTDSYVFTFGEGEKALDPTFAAEAAFFDAPERCGRVGYQATVEADHAGLNSLADPQASSEVGGVDVGDEAVLGVVGERDRLLLGGEGHDGCDGTEDLGVQDLCVGGDSGQYGGWVIEAGAFRSMSAELERCAGSDGFCNEARDLGPSGTVDQRTHVDRLVGSGSHRERAHGLGQSDAERLSYAGLDVKPVRGCARFPAVAHLRDHRAFDDGIQVGIGEDHEWSVPAQLHGTVDYVLVRLVEQCAADLS